jgi:ectoine hydroxylase-related dioxygenase (phytanoyl-CoA dioxygenase family)
MTHLHNAGLYVTTYRELYEESDFAQVQEHVQAWLNSETVKDECRKFKEGTREAGEVGLKPFVIKYREEKIRTYHKDDPLLKLVNPKVQAIVEGAIGPARLLCLDLWHNPPDCCKHNPQWSQSWHRDPEDSQPIKVFVYFSDVNMDSGPFQYVMGSHLAWFDLCAPGAYPAEPIDETKIPWQLFYALTGNAGSVAFANTSGLHRGGHGKHSRTMAVLTFVAEQSQAPTLVRMEG